MLEVIDKGSLIVVNKLSLGPRLPRGSSDIPWIRNIKKYDYSGLEWNYTRLGGYKNFKTGQIIAFNHPKTNEVLVKRLIGLPGQGIRVMSDTTWLDDHLEGNSGTVNWEYDILFGPEKEPEKFIDSLHLNSGLWLNNVDVKKYRVRLTSPLVKQLSVIPGITLNRVIKQIADFNELFNQLFEQGQELVIPKKGMKITLSPENLVIYESVLVREEAYGLSMVLPENGLKNDSEWTITKDYFFVMGDNRDNSFDSRSWGFVAEEDVIGEVQLVLPSSFWSQ